MGCGGSTTSGASTSGSTPGTGPVVKGGGSDNKPTLNYKHLFKYIIVGDTGMLLKETKIPYG